MGIKLNPVRCVFLTPYSLPVKSPTNGTHLRVWMWLDSLVARGDSVDVLCLEPAGARPEFLPVDAGLNIAGAPVPAAGTPNEDFYLKTLRRALDGRVWAKRFMQPETLAAVTDRIEAIDPDYIVLFRLYSACVAERIGLFDKPLRTRPILLDLDDIESHALFRQALGSPRFGADRLRVLEVPALRRVENRLIRASTRVSICSDVDRARLERRRLRTPVEVFRNLIPNAPKDSDVHPLPKAPNLLFLGNAGHIPNAQGIKWFVRESWPRVRAACPHATLTVAGTGFDLMRDDFPRDVGITVRGFVEDLTQLYAQARIALAPLKSGSGTRLKLLEAALFARPAVSTRIGAEGLELVDGKALTVADTPEAFANACVRLINDDDKAQKMARSAREQALALYSPRANRESIDRAIRAMAGK